MMGDWPSVLPSSKPLPVVEMWGHSHISEVGVTSPDQGVAQKIAQMFGSTVHAAAMSGSFLSWHNSGNGAGGDGGWAQVATEFSRDEQIYQKCCTQQTATIASGVTSLTAVAAGSNLTGTYAGGINPKSVLPIANEYLVLGYGANTEIVQVASTYAGGTTIPLVNATTKSHTANDPLYHACQNEGYLAKASAVLVGTGMNDLSVLGPRNTVALDSLVFGTNVGAARGLDPFKHALRACLSISRCSVIYRDTHPNCSWSANWNNSGANFTASYPNMYSFTGTADINSLSYTFANFHYTTTNGSTVTFSTAPDFQGGTVSIFFLAYNDGGGAQWSFTVDGSSTLPSGASGTNAHDNRAMQAKTVNDATGAGTTGKYTITCFRITGLSAGVHTIVVTASTVATYGFFLGWGIEAPTPPLVQVYMDPRCPNYSTYASGSPFGYGPKTMAGAKTATVAANAGTVAGSVTLGSAITTATAGTPNPAATQPGDTITIGTGATQETRRIVGIDSTTTLHVDSNFLNAHTAEAVQIGLQDADLVGGGYYNASDTQGTTSVPGLRAVYKAVQAEFDSYVQLVDLDKVLNGGAGFSVNILNFAGDGLHYNDQGSGLAAGEGERLILQSPVAIPQIAKATPSNRRGWLGVYGDSGASPAPGGGALSTFVNGFTNYFPTNGIIAKAQWHKNWLTKFVVLHAGLTCASALQESQFPIAMFALPIGYAPSSAVPIIGWGTQGPVAIELEPSGAVYLLSGWTNPSGAAAAAAGYFEFYTIFLAEA